MLPNPAVSPEQLLNQPSLPEQPPNLLPNPTVSPEQLLNQPSHPPEQPEHLLNQLVFEIDKPEQTNPTEPEVSTTKIDSRPRADSLQQPELRVYSMRSKLRIVETKMDQQCYQESKPIAIPEVSDLNLPIAMRKEVRSCTQHPISNFFSYNHLSPRFQVFISRLSGEEILKHIHEALQDP